MAMVWRCLLPSSTDKSSRFSFKGKALAQTAYSFALFGTLVTQCLLARVSLVEKGSNWSFHVGDAEVSPDWKMPDFDDSKWQNGAAPFVYGHYTGNTVIAATKGPRPVTTYYRKAFHVEDASSFKQGDLVFRVDDGAVCYLNGQIIAAANLPVKADPGPDRTTDHQVMKNAPYVNAFVPSQGMKYLVDGVNVLAVEVHQYKVDDKDLVFDAAFFGVEKQSKTLNLIKRDSEWSYFDQEDHPGFDWAKAGFDDSSWKTGQAIIGSGDDDVTTRVKAGEQGPPLTTWFRKKIVVDGELSIQAIKLGLIFDDGAIVYINGTEVLRLNMPEGYVDEKTEALLDVGGFFERLFHVHYLLEDRLVAGENVIAVELHKHSPSSRDNAFAMSMDIEYFPDVQKKVVAEETDGASVVDLRNADSIRKGGSEDWLRTSKNFAEVALRSYEGSQLSTAIRAYYASRWAEVFSEYGDLIGPALKSYLLDARRSAESQEFFDLSSPLDDHRQVFKILNDLFRNDPEGFQAYPKLAMAIALVYDQEPPSSWPHHQVGGHILIRKFPDPTEALKFWIETERSGKSLHPLDDLSLEELKYVVDTPASLEELKAVQGLRLKLNDLEGLYSGIEYDHARLEANIYNWPHQNYRLAKIKEVGGICVDQAYYAAQVAKAHGVPSMIVSGAGNNGNHAWVGFLDRRGAWDFSVGRYEDARFVTGITFDPQTWEQPSDHELAMMSERFRTKSKFRVSRIHTVFSERYLDLGKPDDAIRAAEEAIRSEDRNYSAWEALIAAKSRVETPIAEMDSLFEKGARTFSRYADLEAAFHKRLINSYGTQNRKSEADKLRAGIISRNRRERPDLALAQAKSDLEEVMAFDTPENQVDLYKSRISRLKDAGLIAYYALTNPFLEHLVGEDQLALAKSALNYTESRLDAKEGSQLEAALEGWKQRIED